MGNACHRYSVPKRWWLWEKVLGGTVALVLLIVAASFIAKTIRVVPQGYEWTKETFGRYTSTMSPGLHILMQIYHAVGRKMNMMEQVRDVRSPDVITKDNAGVRVDGGVFYQVLDAAKAAYEVMEPRVARILPPPVPEQLSLLALARGEPDRRLDWHGLPGRRAGRQAMTGCTCTCAGTRTA